MIFTRDRYTPFGPYLSLGILGVMFFRPEIMGLIQRYLEWISR